MDTQKISLLHINLFSVFAAKTGYALTVNVPTDYLTIQLAVTAVQGTPNATVIINSNNTFTETVTITQSVIIEAGAGYTPTIQGAGACFSSGCAIYFYPNSATAQSLTLRNLILLPRTGIGPGSGNSIIDVQNAGAGATNILFDGLTLNDPSNAGPNGIYIRSGGGPNNVTIQNTAITLGGGPAYSTTAITTLELGTLAVSNATVNLSSGDGEGFDIRGSQGSGITFTLEDSTFNISAPLGSYSAEVGRLSWLVTAAIRRNTFNLTSNTLGSASGIITGWGNQDVVLDSNRFIGSGPNVNTAYSANPFAGETGDLSATNNVIFNMRGGFSLNPQSGAPGGVVNAILTNNTIDGSRNSAVGFSANDGSTINASIANNLLTNSGRYGFESWVGAGATLNVANSYNDFFNNALGATGGIVAIGSNSLYVDPLYVNRAGSNLHLQSASPVINTGNNSAPSLPSTDADGNPRISGATVDMGAYEYQISASSGGGGDSGGGGGGGCAFVDDYSDKSGPPASGMMLLLLPLAWLLLRKLALKRA